MTDYPEHAGTLQNAVIFGYNPRNCPRFMALFILVAFVGTSVIVLASLFRLIRHLSSSLKQSTRKDKARYRRNVLLMLGSRTAVPLTFGFVPGKQGASHTFSIW